MKKTTGRFLELDHSLAQSNDSQNDGTTHHKIAEFDFVFKIIPSTTPYIY